MTMNEVRREIYETVRGNGRVELNEIIASINADANTVYGAAKHLKWDGYLGAGSGNQVWWTVKNVIGLCPECGSHTEYGHNILEVCPECEWEETWECSECGDLEHDSIEFEGVEVDVTCESVYITPVGGDDGSAFTHPEFRGIIEHFNESEYTDSLK